MQSDGEVADLAYLLSFFLFFSFFFFFFFLVLSTFSDNREMTILMLPTLQSTGTEYIVLYQIPSIHPVHPVRMYNVVVVSILTCLGRRNQSCTSAHSMLLSLSVMHWKLKIGRGERTSVLHTPVTKPNWECRRLSHSLCRCQQSKGHAPAGKRKAKPPQSSRHATH